MRFRSSGSFISSQISDSSWSRVGDFLEEPSGALNENCESFMFGALMSSKFISLLAGEKIACGTAD